MAVPTRKTTKSRSGKRRSPIKFSIKNIVEKKIVDTIIIKPTLIGGFNDIKKINEYCKKNNVRIILTSSFETEIAQNYIIHLISALEIKEYCGVANIELFSKSHHKRDDDKITLPKLFR